MTSPNLGNMRLSDRDLDFVIREAAPDFADKEKLERLIREDEDFRKALVGDERVFRRVMSDEEIVLRISPTLYFEILLRKALKDLEGVSHTIERTGSQVIPVFDTKEVVGLLARQSVVEYLADMLSSFTRVNSYVVPMRVRKGIWRKIRFNDMDISVLTRFCGTVGERERFSVYKRIADACLFILGIFPEYARFDQRYPLSGERGTRTAARVGRTVHEYEEEGRKFYRLAAGHYSGRALDLSEVLWVLYENFNTAKKPLNLISEHYLHQLRHRLFEAQ